MILEIESTAEIVAIEGVPCRKWKVRSVDNKIPGIESFVFTRLMLIDQDIEIDDPHIIHLDGPYPPHPAEFGDALQEL